MRIKVFTLLATSMLAVQLMAQTPAAKPVETATPPLPETNKAGTKGVGFGLMFGTDGAGISLGKCISKQGKMYVQLSGTYAPITLSAFPYSFSGKDVVIDADVKLGSISAILEYHPFGNAFKLSAGAAYMLTKINAVAFVKDSAEQGDIMISPKEVGDIQFGISTNPICPYVGIGFGRAVPRKRVAFNFEIGSYYLNKPILNFKTTGMLEPTSTQEDVMSSNLSTYKWMPSLKMGLIFKLGKLE